MNATIFLTRKQHDAMMDSNPALLARLFAESAARKWSLAGVEFSGLSAELADEVAA